MFFKKIFHASGQRYSFVAIFRLKFRGDHVPPDVLGDTLKPAAPKLGFTQTHLSTTTKRMKKYICIIVTVGLLAACEKRTETATPEASPSPTASSETTESGTTTSSPSP
jgi:hypothetical protein